nr:PREDICTED: thyrotropin-releasing hormone receptor-like [Linepithema humile]
MEFVKNSLGKYYPNMSELELQLYDICGDDRNLDGIARDMIEEIINQHNNYIQSTLLSALVDTNKIKKFNDFCNEDIFIKEFPITNFIYSLYNLSDSKDLFINTPTIETFSIKKYYLPIFIILGLLGNCLSAIVFFRKKMRSFSSSIYLGVLAISDMNLSLMIFIQWFRIMEILEVHNLHWLNYSKNFLIYFLKFLSVWLIIAFIIERYIVTKYPLLRQSWCTVKRAKIVVITLIGLTILYSLLYVFLESTLMNTKDQDIQILHLFKHVSSEFMKKDYSDIYVMANAIIMFTLPALMIIIFNTLIGWQIYQQNCVNKTFISTSGTSSERTQISENKMSDCENKITKMLILVSSMFVILKLPAHYIFYINYFPEYVNVSVMYMTSDLLDTAHYGINFVLYCATGRTFRKELIRIFTKRTNIRKKRNIMEMDSYNLQIYVQSHFKQNNVFVNNAQLKVSQKKLTLLIYTRDYNIHYNFIKITNLY